MDAQNFCQRRGYLVGRGYEVPADPGEFTPPGRLFLLGCNQLVCTRCQVPLRQATGVFPRDPDSVRAAALYDAPDWDACDDMRAVPPAFHDHRVYACRCGWFSLEGYRAIDDPSEETYLPWPWRCGGHPLANPGTRFYGFEIPADPDFTALAERALSGWRPPDLSVPEEKTQPEVGAWLHRLYRRLLGTPMAEALSRAVAGCLTHADPMVRARALRFFFAMPQAPGSERIYLLSRMDRSLFSGHENPFPTEERDLEDWLLGALAERLCEGDQDRMLLDLVRYEALRPGRALPLLAGLAHGDAEWTMAHAGDIAAATPEAAGPLLLRLQQAGQDPARAGVQVARAPGVDRAALQKLVRRRFFGPTRKKILAALTGPPPG